MADKGVSELDAARIYTMGALKASIRRGTAKTYTQALERLEMEQVGDRGCPLTRTVSADNTALMVSELNRRTGKGYMQVYTGDVVRMAWARMDNQPITAYAQPVGRDVLNNEQQTPKRQHKRDMGKVLASLYTEWEGRELETGSEYAYTNTAIVENLKRFFNEYTANQSKTVKTRLAELKVYIKNKGAAREADAVIKALLSNAGKESPDTARLANFATNLWQHFEHKESLSAAEFTELLYHYGLNK
jgi:HrpA-like RNA helicase